jgi:hypothetical protein
MVVPERDVVRMINRLPAEVEVFAGEVSMVVGGAAGILKRPTVLDPVKIGNIAGEIGARSRPAGTWFAIAGIEKMPINSMVTSDNERIPRICFSFVETSRSSL